MTGASTTVTISFAAGLRDADILKQAGGIKRLQGGIDLGGVEMLAGRYLEVGAHRIGIDAAVALDDDGACSHAGIGRRRNGNARPKPTKHQPEEQAGHD